MKIIDLSPNVLRYAGISGGSRCYIELFQTFERDGWNMRRIQINSHDGTHVNVPIHGTKGGKTLNDYGLEDFCGPAQLYDSAIEMPRCGVLFRDQNIDATIASEIKKIRPRFVGLSSDLEFDIEIEKDLLRAGIISYERLCNLGKLPKRFMFYGMPLNIKDGDGSPVRAFAVID